MKTKILIILFTALCVCAFAGTTHTDTNSANYYNGNGGGLTNLNASKVVGSVSNALVSVTATNRPDGTNLNTLVTPAQLTSATNSIYAASTNAAFIAATNLIKSATNSLPSTYYPLSTNPNNYLASGTTNFPYLTGSPTNLASVASDGSTTNLNYTMRGVCVSYQTNATLVAATSLLVNFSPGFGYGDTNYTITSPNDLVGASVTSRSSNNFTLGFTSATITSISVEGAVIHK